MPSSPRSSWTSVTTEVRSRNGVGRGAPLRKVSTSPSCCTTWTAPGTTGSKTTATGRVNPAPSSRARSRGLGVSGRDGADGRHDQRQEPDEHRGLSWGRRSSSVTCPRQAPGSPALRSRIHGPDRVRVGRRMHRGQSREALGARYMRRRCRDGRRLTIPASLAADDRRSPTSAPWWPRSSPQRPAILAHAGAGRNLEHALLRLREGMRQHTSGTSASRPIDLGPRGGRLRRAHARRRPARPERLGRRGRRRQRRHHRRRRARLRHPAARRGRRRTR